MNAGCARERVGHVRKQQDSASRQNTLRRCFSGPASEARVSRRPCSQQTIAPTCFSVHGQSEVGGARRARRSEHERLVDRSLVRWQLPGKEGHGEESNPADEAVGLHRGALVAVHNDTTTQALAATAHGGTMLGLAHRTWRRRCMHACARLCCPPSVVPVRLCRGSATARARANAGATMVRSAVEGGRGSKERIGTCMPAARRPWGCGPFPRAPPRTHYPRPTQRAEGCIVGLCVLMCTTTGRAGAKCVQRENSTAVSGAHAFLWRHRAAPRYAFTTTATPPCGRTCVYAAAVTSACAPAECSARAFGRAHAPRPSQSVHRPRRKGDQSPACPLLSLPSLATHGWGARAHSATGARITAWGPCDARAGAVRGRAGRLRSSLANTQESQPCTDTERGLDSS